MRGWMPPSSRMASWFVALEARLRSAPAAFCDATHEFPPLSSSTRSLIPFRDANGAGSACCWRQGCGAQLRLQCRGVNPAPEGFNELLDSTRLSDSVLIGRVGRQERSAPAAC